MGRSIIVSFIFTLVCGFSAFGDSTSWASTWQANVAPSIVLKVRDKYGDTNYQDPRTHTYAAMFVVTAPDGTNYTQTIRVQADDFGAVEFPGNFMNSKGETVAYVDAGKTYQWSVRVGNQVVTNGKFVLGNELD